MEAKVSAESYPLSESSLGRGGSSLSPVEQLRFLVEMGLAVASGQSREMILSSALESLMLALGGDSALVFLLSPTGSAPEQIVAGGLPETVVEELASGVVALPSTRQALEQRRPVYVSALDAGVSGTEETALAAKYGLMGWLAVPIWWESESLGLACVNYTGPHRQPSREDVDFGLALGVSCAMAIEGERLRREKVEMESFKDEFLSVVAHALKSPLTALKGYSQLLLRKTAGRSEFAKDVGNLEAIESQTNRILNVANKLLDFGRIETGRLEMKSEPVELVCLVRGAIERAKSSAHKHELVLQAEQDQVSGHWDWRAIERVVDALLDNAIRYSPDGGRIEVQISCHEGQATVSVLDRGIGIPLEEQGRLFDKYFRSRGVGVQKSGGLGISLYLSKIVVEALGGRIWAESTHGEGSTFTFILPVEG